MIQYSNTIVQEDLEELINEPVAYEKLRNSVVMVTGANGMLATYLVYLMLKLNDCREYSIRVIGLVRNREKAKECYREILQRSDFKLLIQDVCFPIQTEEDVDYIIHAAGNASPAAIINNPTDIIHTNTLGTIEILKFAVKQRIKNLLFLSTREIYGQMVPEVKKIREDMCGSLDSLDARSCYPESKRLAETLLKSYYLQYEVPFVSARIAHAYGPGMNIVNDGRVMSDFIGDTVNGKNIILKSDGTAERAFCYITDAVCALMKILLEGEIGEAYNVANETEAYEIKDVADILMKNYVINGKTVYQKLDDTRGYSKVARVALDTSKLEKLNWRPQVNMEEGLRRTVESFKQG